MVCCYRTAILTIVELWVSKTVKDGITLSILLIERIEGVGELCSIPGVRGSSVIVLIEILLCMRQTGVQTSLEPICNLRVNIDTSAVTLEASALQNTVLVYKTKRYHIVGLVCTTSNRQIVLMTECALFVQRIHPILVPSRLSISLNLTCCRVNQCIPSVILIRIVEFRTKFTTQVSHSSSRCFVIGQTTVKEIVVTKWLECQLYIFSLIDEIVFRQCTPRPTDGVVQCHLSLSFLTFLGGDNHHAIGSTWSIQSSSRSILQYGHRLNILRVNRTQRTIEWNSINNIQRTATCIDRTEATNNNGWTRSWLTTTRGSRYTRNLTIEGLG